MHNEALTHSVHGGRGDIEPLAWWSKSFSSTEHSIGHVVSTLWRGGRGGGGGGAGERERERERGREKQSRWKQLVSDFV